MDRFCQLHKKMAAPTIPPTTAEVGVTTTTAEAGAGAGETESCWNESLKG